MKGYGKRNALLQYEWKGISFKRGTDVFRLCDMFSECIGWIDGGLGFTCNGSEVVRVLKICDNSLMEKVDGGYGRKEVWRFLGEIL